MGLQPFQGKGPHLLLWAGPQATRRKITVSGISYCLNYCEIFIVDTEFTNVVTGRIIQHGGQRVGGP
jgi:hypothetical protein